VIALRKVDERPRPGRLATASLVAGHPGDVPGAGTIPQIGKISGKPAKLRSYNERWLRPAEILGGINML
jgi:hypothetical protein